ncbi:hypothetical protein MP228_003142 [Amoeboaphelidium protococcarum]|nr:hypothetical protein MP228_003142 [Amoeboaphelidium protococcarum]
MDADWCICGKKTNNNSLYCSVDCYFVELRKSNVQDNFYLNIFSASSEVLGSKKAVYNSSYDMLSPPSQSNAADTVGKFFKPPQAASQKHSSAAPLKQLACCWQQKSPCKVRQMSSIPPPLITDDLSPPEYVTRLRIDTRMQSIR